MLAIGLMIAALFYGRMKNAIIRNSAAIFDQTSTIVTQEINLTRSEIHVSMQIASQTGLARATTLQERMQRVVILAEILRSNALAEATYVGYPNGDFFMLRRAETPEPHAPAGTAFVVQAAAQGAPGRYLYFDRAMKQIGQRVLPSYRFDPRTRPWFETEGSALNITAPYVFFTTRHLGVTLSIRSPAGSVFGTDIDLTSLSDDLARLRPTPSAQAAIVEEDGVIVGYSDPQRLDALVKTGANAATLTALHSPPLLAAYAAALPNEMRADGTYNDSSGRLWRYRATPLPSRGGIQRALLLAVPEDELIAAADQVRRQALFAGLGVLLATIPLTLWLSSLIARPLARLRGEALALRSLDFAERQKPKSIITEIAEFSDTFDTMRRHIRDYNEASTRFVPHEFLEQLGRKDIQGLQLGDHAERTMTVLFSDIRSFTTLSGGMTPQQTFNFVNSYLTRIGPIIRENRGFIDKYIGDAIMALFPESPDSAIAAAIAMQRRVVVYNQERARAGYPPVAIGVGVHRGDLMLGTIGETLRFETTVIADAVNIASRLESLTKTFHVLILASGDVVEELPKGACCQRRLCDVQVKGATHPVSLYEICDADPPDLVAHKVRTLDEFAAGRIAYAAGHFTDAHRAFDEIAEREPRDLPAAYFRDRAWELSRMRDLSWDGIERMESK